MNDYSFIKEVIKEKPFDKKAFFTKAALIVLGAVLFGIIAAITFVSVLPGAAAGMGVGREVPQLNIDEDLSQEEEAPAAGEEEAQ